MCPISVAVCGEFRQRSRLSCVLHCITRCDLATSLGQRRCGCSAGAFRFAAERGGPLFRVQPRHLEHAEVTANRQDDSKGRGRGRAQSKWHEARIGDGEYGSDLPPIAAAELGGAPGGCVLSRCDHTPARRVLLRCGRRAVRPSYRFRRRWASRTRRIYSGSSLNTSGACTPAVATAAHALACFKRSGVLALRPSAHQPFRVAKGPTGAVRRSKMAAAVLRA